MIIPENVTNIGSYAFSPCNLTNIILSDNLLSMGKQVFNSNPLTSVVVPDSVVSMGIAAFGYCTLTNVTLGSNVSSLSDLLFEANVGLRNVYFRGDAPSVGILPFYWDSNVTVHYRAGTVGWGDIIGGAPTESYVIAPSKITILNGPPRATVLAATSVPGFRYITQRSTDLVTWLNIATNTAASDGQMKVIDDFADQGGNPPPKAFYRLRD